MDEAIRCGIALHPGRVLFGNVGSDSWLDFTAIGEAVNMAARLETVAGELGQSILVSAAFAAAEGGRYQSLGHFDLKGFAGAREALRWYLKAAEQGHVGAQYNLGAAYYLGYGVPQNYVEAHKWFSIANVTGLERAIVNRDIMTKLMTSDQIAEAQDLKRDWMARHQTR